MKRKFVKNQGDDMEHTDIAKSQSLEVGRFSRHGMMGVAKGQLQETTCKMPTIWGLFLLLLEMKFHTTALPALLLHFLLGYVYLNREILKIG